MNSRRKEFMGESEINVDLWPAGVWTPKELKDFTNLAKDFGSTSGQLSSGMRGLEPQVVIAFITGAVAAGFFEKLGSEVYENLKDGLKHLLLKSRKYIGYKVGGRLSFSYEDDGIGLYSFYTCVYSSEKELNILFASLPLLNSSIVTACSKSLFPFDDGQRYDVDARLEFEESPKWNVRIRRYSMKGDRVIFNEFFHARIEAIKPKESEWEKVEWEYRRGLTD